MSFTRRLQGTFFDPDRTFQALAARPVWVGALILVLISTLLYTYIISPYVRQDQLKLWDSPELRDRMGEERIDLMLENLRNPPSWRVILTYIMTAVGLVAGFLIAALVILIMGRLGSTEGRYIQIFSVLVHASFIDKLLGNAVRALLVLLQKSFFQATTTLAMFFPKLDYLSSTFFLLNQIDFFQLWMFGIVGLGLVHIFKIPLRRALIISYSFWLLKALLHFGINYLSMQVFL